MPEFREDHLDVNGIDTAVFTAGEGEPLVYLDGAHGVRLRHLLPLAERFRLIVRHHPGFGASADDPTIDSLDDYVLHYLDLLDMLGMASSPWSGSPWAATWPRGSPSSTQPRGEAGAAVTIRPARPGAPDADFFSIPDEELP